MRLIDEYLCRQAADLLALPCSVCLYRIDNENPVVMTLSTVYGDREKINVRFFDITVIQEEPLLIEEMTVPRKEIFETKSVGGDRFHILEFYPDEFPEGPPATEDVNNTAINNLYNNLYYGDFHKDERSMFFRMAFFTHRKIKNNITKKEERTISAWRAKLFFDVQTKIAPEILFANTFPKRQVKPMDMKNIESILKSMAEHMPHFAFNYI